MALTFAQQDQFARSDDFAAQVRGALNVVAARVLKPSDGDTTPTADETAVAHECVDGMHDEGAQRFTAARLAAGLDVGEEPTDQQVRAAVSTFVDSLTPSG